MCVLLILQCLFCCIVICVNRKIGCSILNLILKWLQISVCFKSWLWLWWAIFVFLSPFNEITKVQDPFESSITHTSKHLKCLISRVLVCFMKYYIWSWILRKVGGLVSTWLDNLVHTWFWHWLILMGFSAQNCSFWLPVPWCPTIGLGSQSYLSLDVLLVLLMSAIMLFAHLK